ncbi:MAG: LptF/LptG family permease [Spirochaetales bacterium]|nr:LptF/LptG family permease [Spirochaetales bacterium]
MKILKSRSYLVTYIYISKEFLLSFIIAFLFFFIIFFINQILVMAEQIFSKRVPFWDVIRLIIYSMPIFLAFSFPFGSLVGALMAMGRLSSDNEILAFQAAGISLIRVIIPLLLLGIILSVASFITNDYFLPSGNIKLGKIYRKIIYQNPAIELEPYSIKRYRDTFIITGAINGPKISNITIIDRTENREKRTILADSAELEKESKQRGVVSLNLSNVVVLETKRDNPSSYDYAVSKNLIYNILIKDTNYSIGSIGPAEMSSLDVWKEIEKKSEKLKKSKITNKIKIEKLRYRLKLTVEKAIDSAILNGVYDKKTEKGIISLYNNFKKTKTRKITDRSLRLYQLEFYKKYAIPLACFIFIFFAFPAGLFARKSGRAVGFGVGLLVSFAYWSMLFLGHSLGIRMQMSPFLSMWMANIVILILAFAMLLIRVKR